MLIGFHLFTVKHTRLLAILIWLHMWYPALWPIFSALFIFGCQNWCTLWWPEREKASELLNFFCTLRMHLCPSVIRVKTLNNINSTPWWLWLKRANFTLVAKPMFHSKCKNWCPCKSKPACWLRNKKDEFHSSDIFYPIWMWEVEYWAIISLQKTSFCSGS